jgi:hypothetical protein
MLGNTLATVVIAQMENAIDPTKLDSELQRGAASA